jgi:hypothetical protein
MSMTEKNDEVIKFLLEQAMKLRSLAASLQPGLSQELLKLAATLEERARQMQGTP